MNKQQRGQGAAYSPSSSFPPPLSELRPCMNKCLSLPKPCAHLQSRICPLSLLSTAARVISLTGKLVLSPPASDPSGILHCLRISSHPPLQSHLPSLSAHLELYLRQNTSLQAPLHFHPLLYLSKVLCFSFFSWWVLRLLQVPVPSSQAIPDLPRWCWVGPALCFPHACSWLLL